MLQSAGAGNKGSTHEVEEKECDLTYTITRKPYRSIPEQFILNSLTQTQKTYKTRLDHGT